MIAEKYIVSPEATVKEVISHMEDKSVKAVLVVEKKKLLGLFTLGDMRHYFLTSCNLSALITEAMNPKPIVFSSREAAEEYAITHKLIIYPIVNKNDEIIDVLGDETIGNSEQISSALKGVPLVIQAGGKGTRLYPYTKVLPKALIPIGDLTITERIINSFKAYGCEEVCFILNHKANMIRSYYNDLNPDYSVDFVQETKFLGTGGGLALLKGKIDKTFILSNCDILINADFECIYKTHKKNGNKITFIGAMKNVVIPYGVMECDESGAITAMKEKPEFSFLTNTGVYFIEPEVIDELKEDEFIGLPDIAQRYIDKGDKVGVFPIPESSWLDMGQFSEMESMMKKLGVK